MNQTCSSCGGSGVILVSLGSDDLTYSTCPNCGGKGHTDVNPKISNIS